MTQRTLDQRRGHRDHLPVCFVLLTATVLLLQAARLSAQLPAPPEVHLDSIAPGVWIHTSFGPYTGNVRVPSNGLVVASPDGLILIDTAWGELATERLLEVIEEGIGLPVTSAIVTHAHYDRIAGIHRLQQRGIQVVSLPMTRRLAAEQGLPFPDTLTGLSSVGSHVTLGQLELYYPGPAHAPDNLVVWVPDQEVLFGGCIVRAAAARSPGNTAHADLEGWRQAVTNTRERYGNAEVVVPGHGDRGGIDLLDHTLVLLSRTP